MVKNKLKVIYDFNFTLIGLNSNAKPHKIAWFLNNQDDLSFSKTEDLVIEFNQDKNIQITQFLHQDEMSTYRILKNRAEASEDSFDAFLLPELKQFDYLIILENESTTFDENVFYNKIRQIPFVQFAIKVDLSTLKSRENLIF
jgi:hypothetical protein